MNKAFSNSTLKIAAIFFMLIDHSAIAFFSDTNDKIYITMRMLGRIAFPIFCFLLVEGFLHTHDVKKYLVRLSIFALISEAPFDFLLYTSTPDYHFLNNQNVFFTLALGILVLIGMKKFETKPLYRIGIFIVGCALAIVGRFDYSFYGILFIVLFYEYKENRMMHIIVNIVMNFAMSQPTGALSAFFIESYNGKKGLNLKYVFYAFYPVHLLILALLSKLI